MRTAATLVVVLIAIAPIHAHGQALTPAQVESLRNAKNEVVIQVGGAEREIHGRVIDHTADVVTVSIDGRPYRIPMASVMRLDRNGAALHRSAAVPGDAACRHRAPRGPGPRQVAGQRVVR